MWPGLLLESVVLILLSVWTATTEYGWQREEIDEQTGESMGRCEGTEVDSWYSIPIVILTMIPPLMTGVMAYRTIDVDATYSEAKWIFVMMLVQCQVRKKKWVGFHQFRRNIIRKWNLIIVLADFCILVGYSFRCASGFHYQ